MNILDKLHRRLQKLDIDITCIGNYPWIYLDTVNNRKVTETFMAQHGFTIALLTGHNNVELTDRKKIFEILRKYRYAQ